MSPLPLEVVAFAALGPMGGGAGKGTVYVAGENKGKMKVWMFRASVLDVDPQGPLPKASARYTIEEFGILKATQKTRKAWAAAKEAGKLETEYLGRRAVPEAGGRECYVVRRTSPADQIDPFISGGEAVKVDDKNRRDSFRTVTVYFDCEIVNSEVEHSVILEQSKVHDIARVADSLIGKQVEVRRSQVRPVATRLMVGDHSVVDLA